MCVTGMRMHVHVCSGWPGPVCEYAVMENGVCKWYEAGGRSYICKTMYVWCMCMTNIWVCAFGWC